VGIGLLICILLIIIIIILIVKRSKSRPRATSLPSQQSEIEMGSTYQVIPAKIESSPNYPEVQHHYSPKPDDQSMVIEFEQLEIGEKVGEGAFGTVFKGKVR
jgi:hypothetical protein